MTCFFVIAYLHSNIYLSHLKEKNWAKWAKWARMLKNTLKDEQLSSLTCFPVFACSNLYQNIFIHPISNQKEIIKLNELIELENWNTRSQMSSYAHSHVFSYLSAQTNINTLLYWSYTKSWKIETNSIWIFHEEIFKKS